MKCLFGVVILGLIGAVAFNVYVFSSSPHNTPAYGVADIQKIYSDRQTLNEKLSRLPQ